MAATNGSGRVASSWNANYGLFFEWNAERNIAGNYSDITATVYADFKSWATISVGARSDGKISIGGQEETVWMPAISKLSSGDTKIELAKLKKRVYHNSDGTLPNVSIKAVWPIRANMTISGVTTYRSTIEGTFNTGEITKIPRASEILSSVDFTLENALSVSLKRYSDKFKHDITLKINGTTYKSASNIDTTTTFTFNSTEINNLYALDVNKSEFSTELIVVTKQGTTTIGTTTKIGKMYIDSIKNAPVLSNFEFKGDTKTTSATGWNSYITEDNGLSALGQTKFTIKPGAVTFKNGAIFKRWEVSLNNKTYQSTLSEFTLPNAISYSDNLTVSVVDSRGFKANVIKKINGISYNEISYTKVNVKRRDYPNQTGVNFDIAGKIFKNSNLSNVLTVKYRKKLTTTDTYDSLVDITSNFTVDSFGNFTANFNVTGFTATETYDLEIYFNDIFNEFTPFFINIFSESTVFEVSENDLKFHGITLLGETLFDGDAHEYKSYTLNADVNNYEELEVYVGRGTDYGGNSVRFKRGNLHCKVPLFYTYKDSRVIMLLFSISFRGNTMTFNEVQSLRFTNSAVVESWKASESSYNVIKKVVGYK